MASRLHARLDDLLHEVDMIVFRLERDAAPTVEALQAERARLRRELERLRDQIGELIRDA